MPRLGAEVLEQRRVLDGDMNQPPVNIVPTSPQVVTVDQAYAFTAYRGNRLSISDADAGENAVEVTLSVDRGALTLLKPDPSGLLAYSVGDGTEDSTMTFRGTVSAINTALEWVSYRPEGGFTGWASLTVTTNDLGNVGSGGVQTDVDTVSLEVRPVVSFASSPSWSTLPGVLDTSLHGTGKSVLSLTSGVDFISEMKVQPDGTIFAVGSLDSRFGLMRFKSDLTLDESFGVGGLVQNDFGHGVTAASFTSDSSGRILVVGGNRLARYSSSGVLDETFGVGGSVDTNACAVNPATAVGIQADGKIVVVGRDGEYFRVGRYTTSGVLDVSWAYDAAWWGGDYERGVVIQDDGDILLTGRAADWRDFYTVIRISADGAYLNQWNYDFGGDDFVWSSLALPDGKVLLVGRSNGDVAVSRHLASGELDVSFGVGGRVVVPVLNGSDEGYRATLAADGKILVTGRSHNGSNWDLSVVRMSYGGVVDTSFGVGGKVSFDLSGDDAGYTVAALPDGKIVVAGQSGSDIAFVRLLGDSEVVLSNLSLSTTSLAENNVIGSIVARLSGTTSHVGESLTYALVAGDGDADNDAFTVAGDELQAARAFDFETKVSYAIRLRVSNQAGDFFEKAFAITVIDVNEVPADIVFAQTARLARLADEGIGMSLTDGSDWVTSLDGDTVASYAHGGSGIVRIWRLDDKYLPSRVRDIVSPDTVYDVPVHGISIVTDGNFLGIGSSLTFIGGAHDGQFYTYDLDTGRRVTQFNPQPHWAQYFGTHASISRDHNFFLVDEGGNRDWGTSAAITVYAYDPVSLASMQVGRHVFVSNYSYHHAAPIAFGNSIITATYVGASGQYVLQSWTVTTDSMGVANGLVADGAYSGSLESYVTTPIGTGVLATDGTMIALSNPRVAGGQIELFRDGGGGSIEHVGSIAAPAGAGMTFGRSMVFDGRRLLVGAPEADVGQAGTGCVWVYDIAADGSVTVVEQIVPEVLAVGEQFGGAMSLSGNTLLVTGGPDSAYLFRLEAPGIGAVSENAPIGTRVGSLAAADPDAGDSLSFSLVAGDGDFGNGGFTIVGNEVRTAEVLDYESGATRSIRVRATDTHGGTFDKVLTVAVTDVHETAIRRLGAPLGSTATIYGTPSSAASTAIVGEWLTGDVTATAPAGFEVSSDQVTWGETTSFTAVAGMFSGTLSVRLAATANAGAHAGSVILSGGGAADLAVEIPESMVARKSLTVIGLAAADRTYDGTTTVAVIGTPSLAGTVGADTVSLSGAASWSFPSSNAGAWSLVRAGDFSLQGDAAANYTLAQPSLSAAITPRPVSVKGVTASNRVYDAGTKVAVSTAAATLAAVTGVSASGVVAADAAGLSIDGSAASGAIPDKKVGTRTVTVTGVALAGSSAGNYVIASVNAPSVTISKAALTVDGVVAIDKPYDGTDVAKFDLTKAVLYGVFSGDVVSPAAAGTLGGVDVGGPYAVTAIVTASGADGGNYTVAAPPGLTASVVPKQLTIFGLTAASRVYDGTTDATIGGTAKYVGLAPVDALKYATPVLSGARAGSFADKKVGTAKPVTVSGYSAPSSNYTLAPVTVSATISKKVLAVSGIVAVDKPYDGTKAAAFDLTGAVLTGVVSGDVVTCGATGTLSGTNVGGPYAVTAAVTAVGADGGNYAVTAPADLTASIVPKQLSIAGLIATSRVYDGTTNVMITGMAKYVGLASIDAAKYAAPSLSAARTAAFLDKNVDVGKPVPVSGYIAPSGNYTLAPLVLSASITAKALTVIGAAATSRTYDGTSLVAVSGGSLGGVLGGDGVELVTAGAVGMTADKKAGVGRAVTVSGYSLSGVDAGNYSVTQPTGLKVTIARKVLAVTGVSARSRAYDGTIVGTASGTAVPDPVALVLGDTVTVGGLAKLTFADANVGIGKAVAASGYALSGVDAANYLVQQPAGLSADITPRTLAISGLVAGSRAYDGTTNVTITGTAKYAGLAAIDATRFATPVLSGTRTAAFGDRNVGASKPVPVNGYVAPSANYTLDPLVLVANITPKMLTVTGAVASGRLYDGTTGIKVSGGSLVANGVVASESVALETAAVVGTVADKRVGVGKAVTVTGYTLSGVDSANYAVSQPTTLKATITARPIAVTGLQGLDREYDATTLALVVGEASLDAKAIVGGDDLAVATGGAKFTFASSAVGVAKAITASGFTLSGADAGNYAIVQPAGLKATVTQATITVTGTTLVLTQDPVSGRAVIPTLTATISGLKGADAVTGAAAFTTTATATSPKGVYAVKVGRGTLKSSANYTFAFVDGSITIQ